MEKSSNNLNGVSHGDIEPFTDDRVQPHDHFETFHLPVVAVTWETV